MARGFTSGLKKVEHNGYISMLHNIEHEVCYISHNLKQLDHEPSTKDDENYSMKDNMKCILMDKNIKLNIVGIGHPKPWSALGVQKFSENRKRRAKQKGIIYLYDKACSIHRKFDSNQ